VTDAVKKRLFPLVVASFVGIGAPASQSAAQPSSATVRVEIKNLRSNAGQVGCLLFASADGFPSKPDKAAGRAFVPIADKSATCEFTNVRPGSYAIVAMHDENGNGKLDTNFVGAPTEGTGASRDARPGFMRGPRFEDAVLRFASGVSTLPIPLHY